MEEALFLIEIKNCKGLIIKLIGMYAYSAQDRNDLYQEILLNAWRGVHHFRKESKFSTWLYQVALNTILTYNRKKKLVSYHDTLEEFVIPVSPQSEKKEEVQQLYLAIRQLKETDRAIVMLHLEGYDNPEIADIMGISNNHVGVKLYRIKNQLQEILKSV
ncbi:sigma-70 family RNA polymerase sigma factor [Pelobium sp.]|nr:sigma-70 family RNA polymerase sigma factor [Pelobium sp.]MDA9555173.1 sigma-70 family RNA polymerase sigma factor [Pelobium sp.]